MITYVYKFALVVAYFKAGVQVKQTQGLGVSIAMVVIHRVGSVTTWQDQCTCAQADSDVAHLHMTVRENIMSVS